MAAEVHCSRVCVGWNLLFKSLCWLKPLGLKFVLAEISCSRGCRISLYSRVFKLLFRFHKLFIIVIKSVAGKKKKKKKNPKIVMSLIINGAAYIIIVTLSFVSYCLILILVLLLGSWSCNWPIWNLQRIFKTRPTLVPIIPPLFKRIRPRIFACIKWRKIRNMESSKTLYSLGRSTL